MADKITCQECSNLAVHFWLGPSPHRECFCDECGGLAWGNHPDIKKWHEVTREEYLVQQILES